MKHAVTLCVFLLSAAVADAQPAPPPDKPICVRASRANDYNARPIARHDILARNAVGDRRPVRVSTTCIHLYPESFVTLHSSFNCLGMGDDVTARTIDGHGERCRVVHVSPLVEGSIAPPYK